MSLILWEYFWNPADWVAGPPPPTPPTVPESPLSGAGALHGTDDYAPKVDPWLEPRHPEDYWEERQKYLERHVEPVLRKVIPHELALIESSQPDSVGLPLEQDELFVLQFKRNAALRRAYAAASEEELYKTANRVIKLTLDISAYISQYYRQAAIILLLDLF